MKNLSSPPLFVIEMPDLVRVLEKIVFKSFWFQLFEILILWPILAHFPERKGNFPKYLWKWAKTSRKIKISKSRYQNPVRQFFATFWPNLAVLAGKVEEKIDFLWIFRILQKIGWLAKIPLKNPQICETLKQHNLTMKKDFWIP